jgi:hypothetical protein
MQTSAAQAVQPAAPASQVSATASIAGAHKEDTRPEEIAHAFNHGGLLIRTAQMNNAHHELRDNNMSVEDARANNGHLRKWSMAHADLKPNYYLMGDDGTREAAFLALPDKVGNHVVGVHSQDAFSGGIKPDMKNIPHGTSRTQMNNVLNTLKNDQKARPDDRLDNSEIQTVGMPPASIAGMMFNPAKKFGQKDNSTWAESKPKFEQMLQKAGPDFHGRSFPVFGYEDTGTGTKLKHLDTIHVPVPASNSTGAA